jgi:Ni2+-binding GTPase involved in maturation of urease and hydrogenase
MMMEGNLSLKRSLFCVNNRAKVHKTEGPYKPDGRPPDCTKTSQISIASMLMFLSLIDRQLQEFRDRFDEVNPELRHFMWSSSSANSFSAYHMLNLVKLLHNFIPWISHRGS